ncbi:response regulator [Xanthomonas translucens]|uniref:histidine kinase n=2 Tax=Xanthomonas campestris pv. translucens TaxID=343 RepID=A0A109HKR8_XANCT|nr:response regulator [Xanthomonas translucens]KWV13965.1 hybrid sensor histidine kinase/response regulator [Xanthomonas translucens]OAX61637.1 hybrid sensor histidine kinase/response regulator [Xanthomonas translucens pv. translucens]QSQ35189.1 response regulator [Xanthomonas translucens pv. translucens]QSQ39407.1 response regulator [Xanthomonas translucens pv. translucens]UKE59865.1 response regulator [Xanthomonas translucens pv. hordei]
MSSSDATEHRVLVHAPIGRDGGASVELLRRGGVVACHCPDLDNLVGELEVGAAAVFVAEEGLFGRDASALFAWANAQPAWSDLPFVVLTSHQEQPSVVSWRRNLVASLRNVALLERPVQAITFTSTIKAALRARARQYEVRSLLQAQASAAQELEAQVVARTRELEEANRLLRTQMDERARVEETLRHAQKIEAIGQLTGGVAHDFNNLLMVISGGLAMLDIQTDPAVRKRLMDGMQKAAQRGAGLTRQLLAFSRRQELKPEPVDLIRQIGGMRELLDRSLRGDVHVDFDFAEDLWPIEVDPGELELVVLNLAVNARDAMPSGGTIVVRAQNLPGVGKTDPDFIRLSIVDTGTGMAPEVKARVFEPFYTTKDIGKGSGLGLAQVHGFVQQSGGSIHIDSDLGQGTAIHLLLPRSFRAPALDERHLLDLQVTRRAPGEAGYVLLVEDDDEVAALVGEMLRQLGYQVTRVASATAALGALANERVVDIVFSDIMMPGGMNGLELVHEIRMRRQQLPILLTSGYAEAAKSAAEAEGVQILPKPYRLDELAAALQQVRSNPGAHGKPEAAPLYS